MEPGQRDLMYLDTHTALWLCTGNLTLTPRAAHLIDTDELGISPIVLLEMQLLQEIGRLNISPDRWLTILRREFGVTICEHPFQHVVEILFDIG